MLPKIISKRDNNELIKLPNLEEVKNALFCVDSKPGLDYFGARIFKNYWHVIEKDLFNCILEFFMNENI